MIELNDLEVLEKNNDEIYGGFCWVIPNRLRTVYSIKCKPKSSDFILENLKLRSVINTKATISGIGAVRSINIR